MTPELTTLVYTAAAVGFLHTLVGPDHYLPFVAIGKARSWSTSKTLGVTFACGLGHVLGSVALGMVGVATGAALTSLVGIESVRGDLAAWALTAFGLVYLVWGVRRAYKKHGHHHIFGKHGHQLTDHPHNGLPGDSKSSITIWVLFIVFVLGPCEVLIPLLLYPAAQSSTHGMILVTTVFGVTTIATMMATVGVLLAGIKLIPMKRMERYSHALAGLAILLCGVSIQLGL
ncbi:MAG: sulfite exporter TauE/SafE family protein [Candidatus Zixiibacteriota bacterium]|nr:MAG: sulfite exporter TauE/SafE family protein [candidate division Zixibacteria bacterium]